MAYIGKEPQVGNFVKLDAITTSRTNTYNLLNGGGSTLSNYQIQQQQQYLQSQSSASLRQLSKQRDIALKEQQKLNNSILKREKYSLNS